MICHVEQLILNVLSVSSTRSLPPPDRRSATVEVSAAPLTDPPPDSGLPSDRGSGSKVKLSKLTPKTFNGDLTKWETFWGMFESSIHLNSSLPAVDKFTYL